MHNRIVATFYREWKLPYISPVGFKLFLRNLAPVECINMATRNATWHTNFWTQQYIIPYNTDTKVLGHVIQTDDRRYALYQVSCQSD